MLGRNSKFSLFLFVIILLFGCNNIWASGDPEITLSPGKASNIIVSNSDGGYVTISGNVTNLSSCWWGAWDISWHPFEVGIYIDGQLYKYFRDPERAKGTDSHPMVSYDDLSYPFTEMVYLGPGQHEVKVYAKNCEIKGEPIWDTAFYLDVDEAEMVNYFWVIPTYTLNISSPSNSYVIVNGQSYSGSQSLKYIGKTTINMSAKNYYWNGDALYKFVGWNDGVADQYRSFVLSSNMTLRPLYKCSSGCTPDPY